MQGPLACTAQAQQRAPQHRAASVSTLSPTRRLQGRRHRPAQREHMDAATPTPAGRRLSRITQHVAAAEHRVEPAPTVMAQALVVAQPWVVAGLGTALWAAFPALMRLARHLNPTDTLAGTTLTKEQLEAFSEGIHTMPIGHAPYSITRTHRFPQSVADVLHPKLAPMVGLPAESQPLAMAKRLSFAKVLSDRLGKDSEAFALAYDLVEKIGHETPFAQTAVLGTGTPGNWLSDAAGVLDREQFCAINGLCNRLHATHGVELAVVTLPGGLPQTEERGFATQLFNEWAVGDKETNSGVLIVLSGFALGRGQKKIDIVTGDGIANAGVLTDYDCQRIIQSRL